MSRLFDDVGAFHRKFGLPVGRHQDKGFTVRGVDDRFRGLDDETYVFRLKFMQEELDEFQQAYVRKDWAGVADALADLVYVALGTAHMAGIPFDDVWAEVQRANMSKERAAPDGSNSKRGSGLDVVKPRGWRPPDVEGVLRTAA